MTNWINDNAQHPAVCTIRVNWEDKYNNGADVYRFPMPRNKRRWRGEGIHFLSNDFKVWFKRLRVVNGDTM